MGEPVTPLKQARVFVDGTLTRPQLDHPEGLTVAPDGTVYCGGEQGQVYRVAPDGSRFEQIAHFDGFALGMALLDEATLLVCDLRHAVVQRVDVTTGEVSIFSDGGDRRFVTPNMVAVSSAGQVYVTDSGSPDQPGPGIHRFDRDGRGGLWFEGPLHFANGLGLDEKRNCLFVAETFRPGITRVEITDDGQPGGVSSVVTLDGLLPDGVVVGPDGMLYVGCYEPSRVLRIDPDSGQTWVLADDPTAHTLCHPTNVAVRGADLLTSNLGRWHLSVIEDAFT